MKELVELAKRARRALEKRIENISQEDADDFEQFCLEEYLCGRSCNTSFKYLISDYYRKYGQSRRNTDLLNQKKRVSELLLQNLKAKNEIEKFENGDLYRDPKLTATRRAMLILYFEWGFTYREISDVLGYNESHIHREICKSVQTGVKRRIINKTKL